MSATHRETLTEAEYLARERHAATKHAYLAGDAWPMPPCSLEHNRLAANILVALGRRLAGGPCYPIDSDQRVAIGETGLYTYPDVTVVCGDAQRHPLDDTVLTNPSLVVEVLSEATEAYDRGAKAQHYRQRASLRTYVLVAQDRRHVEVYQRGADGAWSLREYAVAAVIALPTLGVEVPLDEVYAGVRCGGWCVEQGATRAPHRARRPATPTRTSRLRRRGSPRFEEGTPYLPRAPTGQGSALDPFGLTKARNRRPARLQVFWRRAR